MWGSIPVQNNHQLVSESISLKDRIKLELFLFTAYPSFNASYRKLSYI